MKRIKFHIVAREGTTIQDVLATISAIKKVHPNAIISVEVEI